MHEVDDELREIKREIIESRGLVIKTNNLTNALSADIKSIAKRQQSYERRFAWNSATAYVVFVVVVFTSLKLIVDARVDAIDATSKHLRDENARMKQELDDLRQRAGRARSGGARGGEVLRPRPAGQARRPRFAAGSRCAPRPSRRRKRRFLADAVDKAKADQACPPLPAGPRQLAPAALAGSGDRVRGLAALRGQRRRGPAGEASSSGAPTASSTSRRRPSPILEPLVESSADREVQDDALDELAWCQMEIEAYNDAKNTWRTLLRKFPDSHYAPEAKLALHAR